MNAENWDRVQDLFLQASELPRSQCADFLNAHCDDTETRHSVESLLAAEQSSDECLRSIVTAAALDVQTAESEDAVGKRIGPYVVEKEIGHGGMGTVYLAFRDDDQFRQRVAIKVVNRGMDSEFGLSRFRRERQMLADLQHPNIARLLDGGATAEGMPFFAMEYLEGEPITAWCRRMQLDLRGRLQLFLPVCAAVQYAHHQLVIHRDLKPGNILVGGDAIPKLLDFGVATLLDEHCEPASGFSPMTAKYASPEQLAGRKLTTATDIYSLGAILRELLEDLSPQADLQAIVRMAMEQDPDRRYASVEELGADLRRYLEWRPVSAVPATLWYGARKLARRRRYPLLAAAAIVCSLLGGLAAALHQARQAEAARRIADAERRRAESRLAQMIDLSGRSLMDVTALMERLPGALPARRELVGAMLTFLKKLSQDAGGHAALRVALAKAYLRLGEVQGGSDMANLGDLPGGIQSFVEGAALLDGLPPATLTENGGLGVWLDLKQSASRLMSMNRDQAGAIALLREALVYSQTARTGDRALERSKAGLYLALARAYYNDAKTSREYAVSYQHQLEALLVRFPGDDDLRYDLSVANTQIGFDFIQEGYPENALEYYRKSMQLREDLAREHPNDGIYRRVLMLSYQHFAGLQGSPLVPNLGQTEVARAYYKKGLPLAEAIAADPQNSLATSDYAGFLMRSGVLDVPPSGLVESLAMLRKSAAIFESLAGAGGPFAANRATVYLYMSHRLAALGKPDEALMEYEHATSIVESALRIRPLEWEVLQQSLEAEAGMARLFAAWNDRSSALQHADKMLRAAEEGVKRGAAAKETESYYAQAYLSRAQVYLHFADFVRARDAAGQAIRHATPLLTGRAWNPAARILRDAQAVLTDAHS